MKARQFLNVVMQRYGSVSSYAVSRIKPEEHLFYRSTAEARAAAKSKFNMEWPSSAVAPPWMESISRMPPPRLGFERSISDDKRLDFLPFYEPSIGGASKILCVDAAGHTVLYDMDDGSLQPIPCLNSPKGSRPICFSTTNPDAPDPERADVFYLMGRYPVSCNPCNFEALMYSDPSNGGRLKGWHWHRLPSPPAYVDERPIICHALLHIEGDSILVISSGGEPSLDTYCFHTASRKWFKAGPWKLPFYNRAVHVPELDNLLFGVDNDEHNFCAMDVSPLRSDSGPPLVYSWPDLDLPEDWRMLDCSFVYLGAGRFCITKVFEFGFNQRTGNPTDTGAVMSGVEVVRHKKSGLVMVNHRSKFYKFIMDDIQCVL